MGWGKELADFLFTSGEYISEKKKRNKNISEPVPQAKRFVEDYYASTGLTDVTREWGNKVITIIFEGSFVSVNINASHFPLQVRDWNRTERKKFETYLTNDGYIGFRNLRNQKFVTADLREEHVPLRAIADGLNGAWECFKIFTDGKYFYIQYRDGKHWVSVNNDADNSLIARVCEPSAWERFEITQVSE